MSGYYSTTVQFGPEEIEAALDDAIARARAYIEGPVVLTPRPPDIVPPWLFHRIRGQEWLDAVGGWRWAE